MPAILDSTSAKHQRGHRAPCWHPHTHTSLAILLVSSYGCDYIKCHYAQLTPTSFDRSVHLEQTPPLYSEAMYTHDRPAKARKSSQSQPGRRPYQSQYASQPYLPTQPRSHWSVPQDQAWASTTTLAAYPTPPPYYGTQSEGWQSRLDVAPPIPTRPASRARARTDLSLIHI